MSRRASTLLVALLLAGAGFVGGAGGAAWWARERRSDPWRALRVEHEGAANQPTRTRVIFDNPKVPLESVEVIRNAEAVPERGVVAVRGGGEIGVGFDDDSRPSSIEGGNGARALLSYRGTQARVTFIAPDGRPAGDKVLRVGVELRPSLHLAEAHRVPSQDWGLGGLVGEAHAADDEPVSVRRELPLRLDVRLAAGGQAGTAQIEASCPPFACLPVTAAIATPGQHSVRIGVTGTAERSALAAPSGGVPASFRQAAREERETAEQLLPDVAAIVAALGVTASACAQLGISGSVCVRELGPRSEVAGAAVHSITSHDVATEGREVEQRALALYYEDQARRALDRPTPVEVCVSRKGYSRSCTKLEARPFAPAPPAEMATSLELRRGIGGTLAGSFDLLQSDGADCRFSPSPKTSGKLELTFDSQRGTVTGKLSANERGARSGLRCSLGTTDMRWSQTYSATVTQSFSPSQLQGGGSLDLRLTGTMQGTGSYSLSNCRSSGGASTSCPAGRSETYAYPIELVGQLDLDRQTGNGRIVVTKAPLSTSGTWRVPAAGAP